MIHALLLSGCLALGQAAAVPAETVVEKPVEKAAAADLGPAVRKLVRELDAGEKASRDAAEQQLLELGPNVLELLPAADARTPTEVKVRLDRVRTQLQFRRAEETLAASTLTLEGEFTLAELLKEIEKQTGNRLIDYRPELGQVPEGEAEQDEKKIKLSLDKVPYWQAFDQILDEAGLTAYGYVQTEDKGDGLALVMVQETQAPRQGRATYQGALRIVPTEMIARRDLENERGNSLQLGLQLQWEPRLLPMLLTVPLDQLSAVDETGNALPLRAEEGESTFDLDRSIKEVAVPLSLQLPPRASKQIASLKGKFNLLMGGSLETFRFEDLGKSKQNTIKRAGVTVTLDRVGKNDELWEIRMRVAYDKNEGAFQSHLDWVWNNEAYLEDADKNRIDFVGMDGAVVDNETEKGAAYIFDLPAGFKGMTFVYKTPGIIVNMPVEFELRDLDLP